MHLLRGRLDMRQRAGRAIVLDREVDHLIRGVAKPSARLEIPELRRSRTADRLAEDGIEVDLQPAEAAFEYRTQLECHRVLLVDSLRESELGAEAELERQPVLGEPKPRSNTPSGDLRIGALATSGHEIARELEILGDAAGELEGEMGLALAWGDTGIELADATRSVVDVGLEIPAPARHRLVLVDLDLEGVLRPSATWGCERDDCHCREEK